MMRHKKKRDQPYPVGTPFWKSDKDEPVFISLLIQYDEDEVLVSERKFHIHATGSTKEEALENFWRVFFDYEDELADDFEHLSDHLKAQLDYVRKVKAWELRLREAQEAQKNRYVLNVPLVEGVPVSTS